jgi:hypothetical protein
MKTWRFHGILAWVMVTGIILVGLTVALQDFLDEVVIEETAAENLQDGANIPGLVTYASWSM